MRRGIFDMKRKLRIYLDSSVVSALFDDRNPERRLLTESFFRIIGDFDVYVSEFVVAEIVRTPDTVLRDRMAQAIARFSLLPTAEEATELAAKYLLYGAVPGSYPEDAHHIAVAVIEEMDFLLSWNFTHLVRRKTRDVVKMVNTLNGLKPIEIITPAELL